MLLFRAATLLALLAALSFPALRRYAAGGTVAAPLLAQDLGGRAYVVTGAASGIGWETAAQLLRQHARVIVGVRNLTRSGAALAALRAAAGARGELTVLPLDLARLASVRAFAAGVLEAAPGGLAGLVGNAGVMMPPIPTAPTAEGLELHFGANYVGHWALVQALTAALVAGAPSRIVLLSSRASEFARMDLPGVATRRVAHLLDGYRAYADSKLAAVLHARALAPRLAPRGVVALSVHPGVVRTALFRDVPLLGAHMELLLAPLTHSLFKSPWEGAQTSLFALLEPSLGEHAGAYLADCAVKINANPLAKDDALAQRLWAETERLVGEVD